MCLFPKLIQRDKSDKPESVWWLRFDITAFNTLRPIPIGRHFENDIFNSIFLNENLSILITISLKYVPKSLIDSKQALVQIMAGRRTGDKSLSETMIAWFSDAYMRHPASTGYVVMKYRLQNSL